MRRVYDDTEYETVAEQIMDTIKRIDRESVCKYDYGINRAQVHLIKKRVAEELPFIKYGKTEHAYGIGNNNAVEIIITRDNEEQIVGLFHLTDDMYGWVICWCSDIDEQRTTESVKI